MSLVVAIELINGFMKTKKEFYQVGKGSWYRVTCWMAGRVAVANSVNQPSTSSSQLAPISSRTWFPHFALLTTHIPS